MGQSLWYLTSLKLMLGIKTKDISDLINVDIKTQPDESKSEMISIYVPVFKTGSSEALLRYITLIQKTIN